MCVEPDDSVGKTVGDLLGPEYGRRSQEIDQEVFASGKTVSGVEKSYDDGSTSPTLLTTKSPLREQDVLKQLIEGGKSNKEIAAVLDLQVVSVKLYMKTILRKLGATNRTHAVKITLDLKSAA